jgi:SAM-dependent methyltransferase
MTRPTNCTITDLHDANRRYWDKAAEKWKQCEPVDDWRRCPSEPHLAFEGQTLETIQVIVGDLAGKHVCVVGSGDNYASFALAGLGAKVTSVDISEQRLQIAADRAVALGQTIDFVRADAADLHELTDNSFDLVCSTNGFFIWLADLTIVFSEIARILRPEGHYIFYDIHPFQRPWEDRIQPLTMGKPYWDTGPFEYGDIEKTYEFEWTLANIVNALTGAGLGIRKLIESPAVNSRFWQGPSYGTGTNETLMEWKCNPRAGLPVWLTVSTMKLGKLSSM